MRPHDLASARHVTFRVMGDRVSPSLPRPDGPGAPGRRELRGDDMNEPARDLPDAVAGPGIFCACAAERNRA